MDDLTPAARRTQTPNLAMDDFVNLDGMAPATGPQYRIDPTATPLQTPSGDNRGVYTGATATAPTGTQPTGAQAPQGTALIDQIAGLLGIPREQVQQLIPPHLLAGGYSAETIANSPVVKAIRDQQQLSFYRTAPADGEKFGQIQAFGIPLGIRSGQDLNAGVYLRAPRSGQEQIQGAIESTGQYWPDALEQSLRASPVSNYDIGAFGSRRF